MMPEAVLQSAAQEMLDYKGTGMSVMEISHRSKVFDEIIQDTEQTLREVMRIPDNYKVLFLQGGGFQQFAAIPMNLMRNKEADYVHICHNNTIYGTVFKKLPNTKGKILVADMSSDILSEPVNVSDYGLIYFCAQKNAGPAGVVVVVIREDLIYDDVLPGTPTMLKYKVQADHHSLYNTPPCYGIYMCGKIFHWVKEMGGLEVMKALNEKKAAVLYDFLDVSRMFHGTAVKKDRSLMNVPFVTGNDGLDKKFIEKAERNGFVNLKGHRSVGGMRASIYNAMPIEGVKLLVAFMRKFEEENA